VILFFSNKFSIAISKSSRMLDALEEQRPKIVCIDEIEKLPKQFQDKLLNLMQNGRFSRLGRVFQEFVPSRLGQQSSC
jgi:DNA-binding NtrC family response regulator